MSTPGEGTKTKLERAWSAIHEDGATTVRRGSASSGILTRADGPKTARDRAWSAIHEDGATTMRRGSASSAILSCRTAAVTRKGSPLSCGQFEHVERNSVHPAL